MTIFSASGSLPRHEYVAVCGTFLGYNADDWFPAVWFGLHSHPGRAWGCTVMLECGAVYRDLPPHALAFDADALAHGVEPPAWTIKDAQQWDCYGSQFSLHVYSYLDGLDAIVRAGDEELEASYLFTAIPVGDAYTHAPAQAKEFMFMRTKHRRLTIQPTNRVLFRDASFTTKLEWMHLRRLQDVYSCEG
jgi:hypothetical protein